jgi:hypothetical protein
MPPYTLKYLAEAGYIMGLPTIGEVAYHMECHYDAYFLIEDFAAQMADFERLVHGHENESIFKYLTDEDKKRMDDELEEAMENAPQPDSLEVTGEKEIEVEAAQGEAREQDHSAHDGPRHEGEAGSDR